MVYAPPRTDAAMAAAVAKSKSTAAAYGRLMDTLTPEAQEVIRARVTALAAEAAARRVQVKSLERELAALRAERGRR
ncbi:hypothetical protein [Microbacterium maritypicum]|uniref:Uncharacterized protein n=1 Tax=Microbacterium maritypicum TaxID=33918 RepID=A0A4Y4B3K8_MICMQ|nr:hypothetical protein [Microbacterium liquefaciens]GEC74002.1 hypothetical protein MLI01_01470 [Microbacterium liquefaciens]GGV48624.1 hypothetical protein GCM10010213_01480 [Microbacterium liquefaciens]